MDIEIQRIDGALFGARIFGVEPSALPDDATAADVLRRAAIEHHGTLVFEFGRMLEVGELNALTRVFGENEFAPGLITGYGKGKVDGEEDLTIEEQVVRLEQQGIDPYLLFLGNVHPRTGERIEITEKFFGDWEWHTDMSYIPNPPTFTLLHSRQIPTEGGDTGFCSQVLAARTLPTELRRQVEGRRIKHDSTYSSNGSLRVGMTEPATPIDAIGTYHPILRRLPGTEHEALFLGRRTNGYVEDLPLEESEALLDALWAHATKDEFTYRHEWRCGQVVVWDNRLVMHCRYPVDPSETRFMWRTQTVGEEVVASSA
jgi:taurine dioxygenase